MTKRTNTDTHYRLEGAQLARRLLSSSLDCRRVTDIRHRMLVMEGVTEGLASSLECRASVLRVASGCREPRADSICWHIIYSLLLMLERLYYTFS